MTQAKTHRVAIGFNVGKPGEMGVRFDEGDKVNLQQIPQHAQKHLLKKGCLVPIERNKSKKKGG